MRGRRQGRIAVLAIGLAVTLTAASAGADTFYKYRMDGRVWFSNQCPVKHCQVVLRGPKSSSSRPSGETATSYAPSTGIPSPTAERSNGSFDDLIASASKQYQIPEALIRAVIRVESNFNPTAVSRAGARGLMQLMPGTAEQQGVTDRFDPKQNIMGGTRYLRWLANHFQGDVVMTLAGYHAGHNAVERKGGIPFAATEQYVKKVLGHYYRYKASATTASASR